MIGRSAVFGAALLSTPLHAQTDEQRAGARAAATAGGQAFAEQRWSEAVDLFKRAESVIHSPVHLLYLARSYEKLGSLVKAHETYLRVANEQIPAGADPWREAKMDAAREAEALEPRLPHITIKVQGAGAKPVTVKMDGVPVLAAFLGVPQPVDPGGHRFEAIAEGMAAATGEITLREAQRETVELTLTPAAPRSDVAAAPPPAAAAPEADTRPGVSPLTWAAFGVGAVGLGLGTVFALKSASDIDQANGLCTLPDPAGGQSACPSDKQSQINDLDDSARSAKTLAIVGFVAGGVGIAAGVTLLFVGSSKSTPSASSTLTPWVGLGSAGVNGRF